VNSNEGLVRTCASQKYYDFVSWSDTCAVGVT
jgi:hypothetical protein